MKFLSEACGSVKDDLAQLQEEQAVVSISRLAVLPGFSQTGFADHICAYAPQFQDRESMVNLLVGARYGISQVINQRLNIIVVLTEFTSITRVDLLPESERVSLVKIYLQDVKVPDPEYVTACL